VWTERFLRNRRGIDLTLDEREVLESAILEVRSLEARQTVIEAFCEVDISTILIDGLMSRYIDDRRGMRQLVAVHVPGEFVDLHAYPMKQLDHSVGTLTPVQVGIVPHARLKEVLDPRPELARKLWFCSMRLGAWRISSARRTSASRLSACPMGGNSRWT